jgi:hypothetical protein
MGLTRLSEDPYVDGDKREQDEAESSERAGHRRPYCTTAPNGGAVFAPRTDFSLPRDAELKLPRFYMLGPHFFSVEVVIEHLNRIMDAVKIHVCSIVNTAVADISPELRRVVLRTSPAQEMRGDALLTLWADYSGFRSLFSARL